MTTINNGHLALVMFYENVVADKNKILSDNEGKAGIYMWTHIESGDIYIGSATNLKTRFLQYYNQNLLKRIKSVYIYNALLHYGYSAFTLSILEFIDITNLSTDEAKKVILEREQYFLDLLEPEYNILKIAGSSLGFKHSEESIAKMRESGKGKLLGIPKTEEHKARISETLKGKTHSAEIIAKMSEARKGDKHPLFGKFHSAETKAKISESHKGKTYSADTKAKMSAAQGTVIFVYDLEGTLVNKYSSARKAAINFDSTGTTILKYASSGKVFKEKWILSFTLK
jgi:group I intron endonuclease